MKSRRRKSAIRSVVLFHNERKPEAVRALQVVRRMLKGEGVGVSMGSGLDLKDRLMKCDIAVAIGGDGTVLRAARQLAALGVPLLGLNTGGLGFLTAVDLPGFRRSLRRILGGEFEVGLRAMLAVEVRRGPSNIFGPYVALNDCVVRCSDQARAVTMGASSGGRYVAQYFGDGLIVATPTGSTAYALAVGGPVVYPTLDAFLLAPISAHTLTQRPLLVPAQEPISVQLIRRNPEDKSSALVALDGQIERPVKAGDEVHIRRYEKPFRLLLDPRRSYFEILREKFKWGER